MNIEKATEQLTDALKGFYGTFRTLYGQLCVRVDERSYLSTGGNKILADITEDSYVLCDISVGDLGEIFRSRSDINAVIFGCSPDIVSVSDRESPLPVTLEDLARLTGSELSVIPDASAASMLKGLKDASVCLIRGKGVIATGTNCRKVVAGVQIVEKACEAEIAGRLIGGTVPLNKDLADGFREHFVSSYTKRNQQKSVVYVGFNEEEFALRSSLIDHGRELIRRGLTYGSWGNLSVRLNDSEMLITPSSMDFFDIKIEDIVRVSIDTLEHGSQRVPSSEVRMHAMAYRTLPGCGAMIHTRSTAISAFAACEAGFALGEGELQNLIGDIMVTDYAPPGSQELADAVIATMKNTHACVIPHHGGVFYGPSLEVVLAIADAVELKARNLLGMNPAL